MHDSVHLQELSPSEGGGEYKIRVKNAKGWEYAKVSLSLVNFVFLMGLLFWNLHLQKSVIELRNQVKELNLPEKTAVNVAPKAVSLAASNGKCGCENEAIVLNLRPNKYKQVAGTFNGWRVLHRVGTMRLEDGKSVVVGKDGLYQVNVQVRLNECKSRQKGCPKYRNADLSYQLQKKDGVTKRTTLVAECTWSKASDTATLNTVVALKKGDEFAVHTYWNFLNLHRNRAAGSGDTTTFFNVHYVAKLN